MKEIEDTETVKRYPMPWIGRIHIVTLYTVPNVAISLVGFLSRYQGHTSQNEKIILTLAQYNSNLNS